ncbi:MAG: hypothetical protein LBD75_03330 [Candidatus Peribacteria bacterium]|jgi:hypothetical protein|nr:hypothetical protein [Candidatus Peribacteria bacterium]
MCHNNETGLIIGTLLKKEGIQAKLLLTNQGYKLVDTLEMQYFLNICKSEEDTKNKVSLKNVEEKYQSVLKTFDENKNTKLIRRVVDDLKETNSYLTSEMVEDFIV